MWEGLWLQFLWQSTQGLLCQELTFCWGQRRGRVLW